MAPSALPALPGGPPSLSPLQDPGSDSKGLSLSPNISTQVFYEVPFWAAYAGMYHVHY